MSPPVNLERAETIIRIAVAEWQRGEHYDAHEILEDLADEVEDDDDDWAIAIALVKAAACVHKHVHRVGPDAIPGKLETVLDVLDDAPDAWMGLDVATLRSDLHAMLSALRAGSDVSPLPRLRRAHS